MNNLLKINSIAFAAFALISSLFMSCNEETYVREILDDVPVIESFSPTTGLNGTFITVKGEYLKNVDSAAFGTGQAVIYRIINDAEIVLKVTNESASGKIRLKNSLGEVTSSENFTMLYVTPEATEWPTEGEINQDVSISGTNLQSVTKAYFTSVANPELSEAEIVFQNEEELAVRVPFVDADWANVENTRATITLEYNSEESTEIITGPSYTFSAIKPDFEVSTWPTSVLKNSEVNILGTNINLADSIFFGDELATFVKKTSASVTVLVPNVDERSFVTMRVVYFSDLEIVNPIQTEIYTQYRKTLGNFEGGISSMVERTDRVSAGVETLLVHSTDTPLVAPEGSYYVSYYSDPDPAFSSSVPVYFSYNEGDDNTINLNAFEEPVLHFYYFNDSTAAYLQLEVVVGGTNMRLYIERYRTNTQGWELVCIRLDQAEFGTGYDGPFGTISWKDTYDEIHVNYKPSDAYSTQFHIDNVFISEGAVKGAIDLTKHTKKYDNLVTIVE
jgi:hypothetical protein